MDVPPATRRYARAFSLLELLIVVALIVVLFTLYFSRSAKTYQINQIANCEQQLTTVYVALKSYSADTAGKLPYTNNAATSEVPLSLMIPRATTGTEFFICPGSKDEKLPDATPFTDRRISYAYYMGHTLTDGADQPLMSDRQVNTSPKKIGEPLFSTDGNSPGNNHDKYGGNVMFCDGNTQPSPPQSAFTLTNAPNIILLNPKP